MRKKQGLLMGRLVSTFPVMLLIFLVLFIYLILSGFVYVLRHPSVPKFIGRIDVGEDLMFKIISINGEDVFVIDALKRLVGLGDSGGSIKCGNLSESIRNFVLKDDLEYCVVINVYYPYVEGWAYIPKRSFCSFVISDDISYNDVLSILPRYEKEGLLRNRIIGWVRDEHYYVEYYYGGCLNE